MKGGEGRKVRQQGVQDPESLKEDFGFALARVGARRGSELEKDTFVTELTHHTGAPKGRRGSSPCPKDTRPPTTAMGLHPLELEYITSTAYQDLSLR